MAGRTRSKQRNRRFANARARPLLWQLLRDARPSHLGSPGQAPARNRWRGRNPQRRSPGRTAPESRFRREPGTGPITPTQTRLPHRRRSAMPSMNRRRVVKSAAALSLAPTALSALYAQRVLGQASPEAAAAPEGDPIRIGASVSTTGTNGRTGLYQQEAYRLWEAQKNASGGLLGRPVEMVLYDDQSDPTTGARLYERLITEDEVDLVMGPY